MHRWQRIPPTEKRGRVHTSTITVALLDIEDYKDVNLNMDELRIETTRGTGNGGQHKNTTDSCVVITHLPTGIKVVRDGRSQHKNKEEAFDEIKHRINEYYKNGFNNDLSNVRRDQIGNGNRGSEKRRTYNQKADSVTDHINGRSMSLKQFLKGRIDLIK